MNNDRRSGNSNVVTLVLLGIIIYFILGGADILKGDNQVDISTEPGLTLIEPHNYGVDASPVELTPRESAKQRYDKQKEDNVECLLDAKTGRSRNSYSGCD
jgi:hypothetical protein